MQVGRQTLSDWNTLLHPSRSKTITREINLLKCLKCFNHFLECVSKSTLLCMLVRERHITNISFHKNVKAPSLHWTQSHQGVAGYWWLGIQVFRSLGAKVLQWHPEGWGAKTQSWTYEAFWVKNLPANNNTFCYLNFHSLPWTPVQNIIKNNNNNCITTALCPGLPGWAGTTRNTHSPTCDLRNSK